MSEGLQMKYFVLRPKSKTPDDPYAMASREAMFAYAKKIQKTNSQLATELTQWVVREIDANTRLREADNNDRDMGSAREDLSPSEPYGSNVEPEWNAP